MRHARRSNIPIVIDGVCILSFRHLAQGLINMCIFFNFFTLVLIKFWALFQDGLFLVTNNLELVSGYALAVLTPNVNEYKRLVQKVLSSEVNDIDAPQQLLSLAKQ